MLRRFNFLLSLWLLTCLFGSAWGDGLSELPTRWQGRLQAVDQAEVSGAEPTVRQALDEARQGVAASLADPGVEDAALARGYGALGNLYQVYKIPALAEPCYANARVLEPENFRWAYYAGYLALEGGRIRQALARLEMAARIGPGYAPLQLQQGRAWYELSELDKARAALESAAETKGLRAAALYYLGQIDLLQRDYEDAIGHLREALDLDPQASAVHYPLARAYRAAGDQALARDHLALRGDTMPRAADPLLLALDILDKGARPFFASAMQAIEQGDYTAAEAAFRRGLERDPENLNARVSLGRAQYLAGQQVGAAQTLRQVLTDDPDQVLAGFLLGVLRESTGDGSSAESTYRQVLAIDAEHAGAHFFLANQLMRRAHYRQAASHYQAALDSGQQNPFASLYLVIARHRAGQPEAAAARDLRQQLERHPERHMLKYALVRLLASSRDPQLREPAQALQLANDLMAAFPAPPHMEALALAQAANGDFEQAIALQSQLLAAALWAGQVTDQQRLQVALEGFESQKLPDEPWPEDDRLLSPMPIDAQSVFREYPSPVPY